jgi:hypothetical protein
VGMTFGRLNVVLQNQAVIVQHCKNTLNNIAKLKLFLNKEIVVLLLCVMLVIGPQPKVYQLSYISFVLSR